MKAKLLMIPLVFVLAGCLDDHEDLQDWMEQAKKEAKLRVQKPQPPAPVQTVEYTPPPHISPHAFSVQRMRSTYKVGNAPDVNRAKEVLENYDLNALKFVGVIGSGNALSGLVEVDGHVYTVKPGNHMGKNYGRIVRITADQITLRETVEDSLGNWVNRDAKLIPAADAETENAVNNN